LTEDQQTHSVTEFQELHAEISLKYM